MREYMLKNNHNECKISDMVALKFHEKNSCRNFNMLSDMLLDHLKLNKPDGDQALTAEHKFDYNLMQIVLSSQIQVPNQAQGGE